MIAYFLDTTKVKNYDPDQFDSPKLKNDENVSAVEPSIIESPGIFMELQKVNLN